MDNNKPFMVVFNTRGVEYVVDLEEENEAFKEYMMNKLRSANAAAPSSRIQTVFKLMDIHDYKELEAWAFNSEMQSVDVWNEFESDFDGFVKKVKEVGIKLK